MDADALAEFLAAEGEFGPVQRRSGRLLDEMSPARITAAENLLTKAARSLSTGDGPRAEQLIDRAARMPLNMHEEGSPGVMGASMLVDRIITDQSRSVDPTT